MKFNFKKIRVGVVGPLTGPRACYGEMLLETIKNTSLNSYAEIIPGDDQADPECAKQIAKSLVEQNVLAVIGHFNSMSAQTASPIYSASNIPLLLPASTLQELTKMPCTFRLCANDMDQIKAIVSFISTLSYQNISIWVDNSTYSIRLKNLLLQHAPQLPWTKNTNKENDVLILLGTHHHIIDYLLTHRDQLSHVVKICCDDCSIQAFIDSVNSIPNVWIATPNPDFSHCVKKAADCISLYLQQSSHDPLPYWLENKSGLFLNRENASASFKIQRQNIV